MSQTEGKSETTTTEEKRRIVAGYLNLAPWLPETWPIDILDRLIAIREQQGLRRFMVEIMRMMEPPPKPKSLLEKFEEMARRPVPYEGLRSHE